MARKLAITLALLCTLGVGCTTSQMIAYKDAMAQAMQTKTQALAQFQIFDANHQIVLITTFFGEPATMKQKLTEYRERKAAIEKSIVDLTKKDAETVKEMLADKTKIPVDLAKILVDRADEANKKIVRFILDENELLKKGPK